MSEIHQIINDKAGVYTLLSGKTWKETGPSGQLMVYHPLGKPDDILVRWWRGDKVLSYQLTPGHLKSRGPNVWVVRAFNLLQQPPVEEILAIRLLHPATSDAFRRHFEKVSERVADSRGGTKHRRAASDRTTPASSSSSSSTSSSSSISTSVSTSSSKARSSRDSGLKQSDKTPTVARSLDVHSRGLKGLVHRRHHGSVTEAPERAVTPGAGMAHSTSVSHSHSRSTELHKRWLCSRCSNMNLMSSSQCIRCYKPKPDKAKVVLPRPLGKHHPRLLSDLSASLPELISPVASETDWCCTICTFRNQGSESRCQICGSPNFSLRRSDDEDQMESQSPDSPVFIDEDTGDDLIQRMMHDSSRHLDRERIRMEMEAELVERLQKEKEAMDFEQRREIEDYERRIQELRKKQASEQRKLLQLCDKDASIPVSESSPSDSILDDSSSGEATIPGSWTCETCTLINSPSATKCRACRSAKPLVGRLIATAMAGYGGVTRHRDRAGSGFRARRKRSGAHQRSDTSGSSLFSPPASVGPAGDDSACSSPIREHSETAVKLVQDYQRMRTQYTFVKPTLSRPSSGSSSTVSAGGSSLSSSGASSLKHSRDRSSGVGSALAAASSSKRRRPKKSEFETVAREICCYNENPVPIFQTLKGVVKKLLRDDPRYRRLDTTNPRVEKRLIGFEGVLDFLHLMGFKGDAAGHKLILDEKPTESLVDDAWQALDMFEQRMTMFTIIDDEGSSMDLVGSPSSGAVDYRSHLLHSRDRSSSVEALGAPGAAAASSSAVSSSSSSSLSSPSILPKSASASPSSESALCKEPGALGSDDAMIDDAEATAKIKRAERKAAQKRRLDYVSKIALRQIVSICTEPSQKDRSTMDTLLLCHVELTDSFTLISELRRRFFQKIPSDMASEKDIERYTDTVIKPIQGKVIKSLQLWMHDYWESDFKGNSDLQNEVRDWVKKMDQKVKIHPWNGILAQYVRDDLKKYRKYGSRQPYSMIPIDYSSVIIPRRFSIYSLSKNDLADQITIMDYRIFSSINPRECLGQRWKKKDGHLKSPNILKMIAQFNNLTRFVQIQVLREKSLNQRSKILKRLIKMADRFHRTRNYNSLCAVYSALESHPIYRLKCAWERVPLKEKKYIENYKVIFSRDYNHRVLRNIFNEASGLSCIPHIGIFLQDLLFIDEGSDAQSPDSDDDDDMDDDDDGDYINEDLEYEKKRKRDVVIGGTVNEFLSNFSKHVRIAERIKKIQEFQRCPFTKIEEFPVVQRLLIEEFNKVKDITDDIIWDMSTEVKRQDEREKEKKSGSRFFS